MQSRAYPVIGGVILGFVVAAVCFAAGWARPATAQIKNGLTPIGGFPQTNIVGQGTSSNPSPVQPIEVQSLDKDHFVVATREPRLVTQIGREGTAQNMLVTVITHYTVREDRLLPVEHVRVPAGYRVITFSE